MSLKYYNSNNSIRGGFILPSVDLLHVSWTAPLLLLWISDLKGGEKAYLHVPKNQKPVNDSQVYILYPKHFLSNFLDQLDFQIPVPQGYLL